MNEKFSSTCVNIEMTAISIFTVSIGHNWPKWVNILLQLPAILESLLEFLYNDLKAESEAIVHLGTLLEAKALAYSAAD